jgi:hypothetical protein
MSIYKKFEADDIVSGNPTEVTVGLWSGDTGSLTTFFSATTQASSSLSGQYYWDVYQTNVNTANTVPIPEIQFSLAYGHRTGGGGPTLTLNDQATLATQAVYSQYRNLLLDPGDTQFTFDGNVNKNHIYVVNIARNRLKQTLDPGNWQLTLSGTSGIRTFVDDSGQTLDPTLGKAGAVYKIVSGAISGSSGTTIHSSQSSAQGGYGLAYPTLGILVLNPDAITTTVGFTSGTFYGTSGSTPFAPNSGTFAQFQYNHAGLYNCIKLGKDFQARSAETITSTHYFVRVRNKEFNYSNNPTFFDETDGSLVYNSFIKDPQVFPTTVGLYNSLNELVAVAKLSKPVKKSFDRELLIRVRLDW